MDHKNMFRSIPEPFTTGVEEQPVRRGKCMPVAWVMSVALFASAGTISLVKNAVNSPVVHVGSKKPTTLTMMKTSGNDADLHVKSSISSKRNLDFKIRNEYDDAHKLGAGYPFLTQHRIVEPYRETTFSVFTNDDVEIQNCDWSASLQKGGGVFDAISGVVEAASWSASGEFTSKAYATFPAPGSYNVHFRCDMKDGTEGTITDIVDSYYVRRELRELSNSDKNQFLDTFLVLAHTPTERGRKLYGDHYVSLLDLEVMHLRAASDKKSDKMHDGMGFLTQHVAMTSEFELAMQSVKPHLAIPYWDYTIDSAKIRGEKDGHAKISSIFTQSELFQKDWFGATDSKAHTVTEGRFSHLPMPRDYNFTTRSAYGYLRAPWNINPNRYVTRYHSLCGEDRAVVSWPTCGSHFRASNTEDYDSWYDWVWSMSYDPHGPVHVWIGGTGGQCSEFDALNTTAGLLSEHEVFLLKQNAFQLLKDSYRTGVINVPKYCAPDAGVSECMWKCNDLESNPAVPKLLHQYIPSTKSMSVDDQLRIAHKVFCDTPFWPGDHLEAGSPVEASFWPIHPTLERLLQYKDMVRPFTDTKWMTDAEDWKACIYSTPGPADDDGDAASNCKGHHAYDLTFSKTVKKVNGVFHKFHMTNQEVRHAAMPVTGEYSLSYIYNHFNWDHCTNLGYSFKAVE